VLRPDLPRRHACRHEPQAARPVELAGLIDELDEQGWRVGGVQVLIDSSTRLSGTPERGAWVLIRGDDDDDDDGRVYAREATIVANTAVVVGPLQVVDGETWTVAGVRVRVPAALGAPAVQPGCHGAGCGAP
jgi:hypothetical protein